MSKCDFNGETFHELLDNICLSFGSKLNRQSFGIYMGITCVPLLAKKCFCFVIRETLRCFFLTRTRLM